MKKNLLFLGMVGLGLSVYAQQNDVTIQTGAFSPDWNSLNAWECPEWFKDAKFGIWAHWGPQCHAEDGDWYARFMYYNGTGQNQWHKSHFGDPATFGLKELCNDWKAQNWNPEALVDLYKSVGARYFMALGNHHDNFDLWDSPYQEWNSVNIGPQKDIIKGWSDACKKAGLPLGVSIHASHAWTWLEPSQAYDGNLTKADGVGKWWEGYDPQELYAQRHTHSTGWSNSGTIHSQWDWGNGASLPSVAYKQKFQNRVLELINDYAPSMIYFDDTAMPFYGCDDEIGKNILAHYYNVSAATHDGIPDVVVTGKQLNADQKDYMLWDVERGIPDRMQEQYWQTCTCIGDWHYNRSVYDRNGYKSGATVVRMLIDVVSKNGNLLLSIPVRSDGTIDDKEERVLADIKAWMDINSESIYGTRTWNTFGEGPLADAVNPMTAQGFNEGQNYSSQDVRYVQKNGTVYATIMAWPVAGAFTFKSFSVVSDSYAGKVKSVKLLGYSGDIDYKQGIEGLTVTVPGTHPNEIAPVFAITMEEGAPSAWERLQEMVTELDAYVSTVRNKVSYINTGQPSTLYLPELEKALAAGKAVTEDADDAVIVVAERTLLAAYQTFVKNGTNKGGVFDGIYERDETAAYLLQASNFTRKSGGSARFGAPLNWTVENFNIPNGGDGTKAGLDKYSGREALMLGVWNDRQSNTEGNLANARIYRKITLPKGTYYFGAGYNTHYSIGANAYMFVSPTLCATEDIPQVAIAYYPISQVTEDLALNGLWFQVEEEQDVYIGFQVDLASGSATQEFRAEKVALYRMADVHVEALQALLSDVDGQLKGLESSLSLNTGFYHPDAWQKMRTLCDEWLARVDGLSVSEVAKGYYEVSGWWADFLANGKNRGGLVDADGGTDITVEVLKERKDFTRSTSVTTRFAAPKYWTVENFRIPNGNDGTKAGLDKYEGPDALMLGVWGDRQNNQSGNLRNARIYQQVTLEAGRYFWGAAFNALHQLNQAYLFVADRPLSTSQIETQSVAYFNMNECAKDLQTYGLYFTLEEPRQLILGFQADLAAGSETQEFRAETVTLLRYEDDEATNTPQLPSDRMVHNGTPMEIYTLQGFRTTSAQQRGIYIIRQNGKSVKTIKR